MLPLARLRANWAPIPMLPASLGATYFEVFLFGVLSFQSSRTDCCVCSEIACFRFGRCTPTLNISVLSTYLYIMIRTFSSPLVKISAKATQRVEFVKISIVLRAGRTDVLSKFLRMSRVCVFACAQFGRCTLLLFPRAYSTGFRPLETRRVLIL